MNVCSIPAEHVYTQAIQPEGVEFLPDPDIDGHWWPHPALEASWWDTPRDVDVVHIHFGFEHRTPAQLRDLVAALPVPLVITVHDLDNPHLEDQSVYHESLGVLVDAADAVITLTECAAATIRTRYSCEQISVIPHPVIAPASASQASNVGSGVAVFVKSLRTNVVTDPQFYMDLAAHTPLTVYVHNDQATERLRRALEPVRGLDLIVHDPFDDEQLHEAVSSHAVCVLPYLRGTHSGWLEMCRDLAVSVAVPDCGCYADQADTQQAVGVYATGNGAQAGATARDMAAHGPLPYHGDRLAELEGIKQAHARAYRAARDAFAAQQAGGDASTAVTP